MRAREEEEKGEILTKMAGKDITVDPFNDFSSMLKTER